MSKKKANNKPHSIKTYLPLLIASAIIFSFFICVIIFASGNNEVKTHTQSSLPSPSFTSKMPLDNIPATPQLQTPTLQVQISEKEKSEIIDRIEKLIFDLNELVTLTDQIPNISSPGDDSSKNSQAEKIEGILKNINPEQALTLVCNLKDQYNGIDGVLDEYLLSLQLNINLEEAVKNKDTYEKQKKQKLTGVDTNTIITLEKIDTMQLEKINNLNKKKSNPNNSLNPNPGDSNNRFNNLPDLNNIKPRDPLEGINPNSHVPKVK